ncbi:MAG: hypothetical protein ABIH11_04965 [Candidatus Altiarchaeota archaeon]
MVSNKKPINNNGGPSRTRYERPAVRRNTSLQNAGKRQTVYNIIHRLHSLRIRSLREEVEKADIESSELKLILKDLEKKGLIYTPKPGVIGCVDD